MSAAAIFGYCTMVVMIVPVLFGAISYSGSSRPIRFLTIFYAYSLCSSIFALILALNKIPNHLISHIFITAKSGTYFLVFTYFLKAYGRKGAIALFTITAGLTIYSVVTKGGIDRYPSGSNIFTSITLIVLSVLFIQGRIMNYSAPRGSKLFSYICVGLLISESISVSVYAVINYLLDTQRHDFLLDIYAVRNLSAFVSTLTIGYGYLMYFRENNQLSQLETSS